MIPPEELAVLMAELDADYAPNSWADNLPPGAYFDADDNLTFDPEECF